MTTMRNHVVTMLASMCLLPTTQCPLPLPPIAAKQEFVTYLYWENKHGIELDYYSLLIKSMHDSPNDVGYGRRLFGSLPSSSSR